MLDVTTYWNQGRWGYTNETIEAKRPLNNNQTLHELTKWRKNITGSYKEVQLKMAFWGINCTLHTQRERSFGVKDLTGIYECRGYLKWTVCLEFPLFPLLFFSLLERNRQTFGSLSREIRIVVYHETDIPKEMSSSLCFQKVSLHCIFENLRWLWTPCTEFF